jgi:iron complex outermembrane receptor protein
MKRIAISVIVLFLRVNTHAQNTEQPKDSFYLLTPVEVRSVRAGDNAPFAKTNIGKQEISKNNLGQDIPFILNQTPSVVVNSDAGNGIGYTGIRIRGTDATRINVTLNGIPYNDAESQGTFFVDLPDFASSTGSIQVLRGVGTSSNGAGAFGASINISTNEVNKKAYAEFNNSMGSFNSFKNTLKLGSGLLGNRFTVDARLSHISSDGFIDRASSKLKSAHFTVAYINDKTSVRFNVFSGHEETYQAWYGIPEEDLKAAKRKINYAGTEKPGAPYDNETDNYEQNHYQLFYNQSFGQRFTFNTAFFITDGIGYYEQYKANQEYNKYGLPNAVNGNGVPVTESDMIRRLWLDNRFYGNIFSLHYKSSKTQASLGGGISRYNGLHFGKVIWAKEGLTNLKNWYDLDAHKTDFNIYLKKQTAFCKNWFFFTDFQYRYVKYSVNGFRNNPNLLINISYNFFNPKGGISFNKNGWKGYASFSVANKEPNRDDFEAGQSQQPKPERLYDTELGIERTKSKYNWSATLYYMSYKNQLVLTGKINDVGAYTRTNIPHSYRAGIELQGGYIICKWMNASANLSFSRNKLKNFTEYIDDYDNGGQKTNHYSSPDIAFSPAITGSASVSFLPIQNFEIALLNKFVSKQYLDNTQDEKRRLDAFFVQDLRFIYAIKNTILKDINMVLQLNNLLNAKYEPNGYTYNYIYNNQLAVNNYYFPMAGINFMFGVNVKL